VVHARSFAAKQELKPAIAEPAALLCQFTKTGTQHRIVRPAPIVWHARRWLTS
jgi:hypothetical protein